MQYKTIYTMYVKIQDYKGEVTQIQTTHKFDCGSEPRNAESLRLKMRQELQVLSGKRRASMLNTPTMTVSQVAEGVEPSFRIGMNGMTSAGTVEAGV